MNTNQTRSATVFKKDNEIYQCHLQLTDGNEFVIPMRNDGYVLATKLCQASTKQLVNWRNSTETRQVVAFLSKKLQMTEKELIHVRRGGNDKNNQGTWVHPDLGIHLANWCSPIFSIQVSRWVRELIITGSVELGNEKSIEQVQQTFKERMEHAEQLNTSLLQENKRLQEKYDKLYLNHQYYLRRKKLHKLPEGKCVYIVNTTGDDNDMKLKIGKSENITGRVSGFRTSSPLCKLMFLMYTDRHNVIESEMKRIYEDNRPNDREFIEGVPIKNLKQHFIDLATILRSNYRVETEEQLSEFNKHLITEEEAQEVVENEIPEETQDDDGPTKKRCGGQWHTTEEERMVPLEMFYRHSSHKDGRARLCKDCYAKSQNRQGYNEKCRRDKPLPEFDPATHKWCNRCENVKEHAEFYRCSSTKDGLCSNCKTCKTEQKKNRLAPKNHHNKIIHEKTSL
jgi:hypothetical protein